MGRSEVQEDIGYVSADENVSLRVKDHLLTGKYESVSDAALEAAAYALLTFDPYENRTVRTMRQRLSAACQAGKVPVGNYSCLKSENLRRHFDEVMDEIRKVTRLRLPPVLEAIRLENEKRIERRF